MKNIHSWKILTPEKYSDVIMHKIVSLSLSLSLYLSFCKYSSRSLSSPDDKLSENIWFVWSKTSFDGDKWRCHQGDRKPSENRVKTELVSKSTKDCWTADFRKKSPVFPKWKGSVKTRRHRKHFPLLLPPAVNLGHQTFCSGWWRWAWCCWSSRSIRNTENHYIIDALA